MLHLGSLSVRGTKEYAGVVELADTYDLGDVTSVKVFHFVTRTEKLNKRA